MSEYFPNPRALAGKPEEKHDLHRGWKIATPLHLWHLTSLDAPTVAVVWSSAFAWAAGIRTQWWTPLLLALVAWTVYIGDRLLDARAGLHIPPLHELRERHYFHWQHRKILGACAISAGVVSAWMIAALLPATARAPDSALGAATVAYFSGVHWRRGLPPILQRLIAPLFSKEFLVGVLFTAGCLVPAWSQILGNPGFGSTIRALAIPAVFFAGLAWFNCYAIAQWESATSGARAGRVGKVGCVLGVAAVTAAILLAGSEPRVGVLLATVAISAFLLAGLDRIRAGLSPLTVRAAADLVLLSPALMILERLGR